jgi:beta-galactosidase
MNTDSYGTNDFYLTPYLKEGANRIALEFTGDIPGGDMEDFTLDGTRLIIENLYIWSQPRIHIFDYTATGHFDEEVGDVILDLDVIVVNSFNTDEKINVGYDIYDPNLVLKDYSFVDAVIPGRGCDTVRFRNKVFGTEKFQYSAERPELYSVMLSLKYHGRPIEYIPIKVGFGLTGFDGEYATRSGKQIFISAVEQDAPTERNTLRRLRLMKRRGINTLYLTHPQQKWFYDMCAEEGMYIIDRAAVECDPKGGDRGPEGTVANDPSHVARFIDRQQAMYYRNRNYPNVIGWATGSESGNGYNMYESYRWLKSADTTRMVVYPFAEGEWNTDIELPESKPLEDVLEGMTAR